MGVHLEYHFIPCLYDFPNPLTLQARLEAGGNGVDGDDCDGQAYEALRSVKKLAEVKHVFDRFAVDGMLTANEALQALTEAGCTAPRTHAGRYLRSRRFFGLRREVSEKLRILWRAQSKLGTHAAGHQ